MTRALLPWIALIASCTTTVPRTQVMLVIDAEPRVRADTDVLVVEIAGSTGREATFVPREERTLGASEPIAWPIEIPLLPLDGDVRRIYRATASARRDGVIFASARAISGYVEGRTLRLDLVLEDACIGRECMDDETCKASECVDAVKPAATLPSFAADARDAEADRTASDASVDSAPDEGSDAGEDSETDAAEDADAAPIDPCATVSCGDDTLCVGGTCRTYSTVELRARVSTSLGGEILDVAPRNRGGWCFGGRFRGEGTVGDATGISATGASDGFVSCADLGGSVAWNRRFQSLTDDSVNAVAVDPVEHNVFVVGKIGPGANLPGGATYDGVHPAGFVSGFAAGGAALWTVVLDSGGNSEAFDVFADGEFVFVVGASAGGAFDALSCTRSFGTPDASSGAFFARFTPMGGCEYAAYLTAESGARFVGVTRNDVGRTFAVGETYGDLHVGADTATPISNIAGFVVEAATDGDLHSLVLIDSTLGARVEPRAIVGAPGSAHYYVGGSFEGTIVGGPSTATGRAGFVVRMGPGDPAILASATFVTRGERDGVSALAIDPTGRVFVTGLMQAFDGVDAFVSVRNPNLGSLFDLTAGGPNDDVTYGLAIDDLARIAFVGSSPGPFAVPRTGTLTPLTVDENGTGFIAVIGPDP